MDEIEKQLDFILLELPLIRTITTQLLNRDISQLIMQYVVHDPICQIDTNKQNQIKKIKLKDGSFSVYVPLEKKWEGFTFYISPLFCKDKPFMQVIQIYYSNEKLFNETIELEMEQDHRDHFFPCVPLQSQNGDYYHTYLIPKTHRLDTLVEFLIRFKKSYHSKKIEWGQSDCDGSYWIYKTWFLYLCLAMTNNILQISQPKYDSLKSLHYETEDDQKQNYPSFHWTQMTKNSKSEIWFKNELCDYQLTTYQNTFRNARYNRRYFHYHIEIKKQNKRIYEAGSIIGNNFVSQIVFYWLQLSDIELSREMLHLINPAQMRCFLLYELNKIKDWN